MKILQNLRKLKTSLNLSLLFVKITKFLVFSNSATRRKEYTRRKLAEQYLPRSLSEYIHFLSLYNNLLKGFCEVEKVVDFTSGKISFVSKCSVRIVHLDITFGNGVLYHKFKI